MSRARVRDRSTADLTYLMVMLSIPDCGIHAFVHGNVFYRERQSPVATDPEGNGVRVSRSQVLVKDSLCYITKSRLAHEEVNVGNGRGVIAATAWLVSSNHRHPIFICNPVLIGMVTDFFKITQWAYWQLVGLARQVAKGGSLPVVGAILLSCILPKVASYPGQVVWF